MLQGSFLDKVRKSLESTWLKVSANKNKIEIFRLKNQTSEATRKSSSLLKLV